MNTQTATWKPLVVLDETQCPQPVTHSLPWKPLLIGWVIINIIYLTVQAVILIQGLTLTQTLTWLPPLPATLIAAILIPALVSYTMTLSRQVYAWTATLVATTGACLYLAAAMNAGRIMGWW